MKIKLVPTAKINLEQRQDAFRLYGQYYEINEDDFYKNFMSFDYQGLAFNGKELVGILGVNIKYIKVHRLSSIYFGNAALNVKYRTSGFVQKVVLKAIFQSMIANPRAKHYIWCHAVTYRPYLFYAKVLKHGFPRRGVKDSVNVLKIRDLLIGHSELDHGQDGWVSIRPPKYLIKDSNVVIGPRELKDPDIQFYQSQSIPPDCGLYTFAPVNISNLLHYFQKKLSI